MTEQNAHDDERDTADLAAGDTADLPIDDATDLAAADTARPQAPAEQLTPAGRAVSPSPSPTPTFAATDRPARRARRLRWKPGITRPMMALSAASFALMVAGVGGYVSAIPAVVAGDKPGAVVIPLESALWLDGQMREVQAGSANSTRAVGPLTVEGSKTDAAAPDAAAALGIGSSSGMLGVASLTGASAASSVDSSFTRAQQIAGASVASGSGSASGSAASTAARRRRARGLREAAPRPAPVRAVRATPAVRAARRAMQAARARKAPAAPVPHLRLPRPTAEQEAAAYAVLVDHQARVNAYVVRLNNAVAAFNNDCMSTSRPLRQSDYNEYAAIDSQTLTDFLLLRNSNAFADGSRWLEQKGNLQRAYIALDQYLTVIYDAWGLNLEYENPAEGVDRWMEPVRADQDASGNSMAAAHLNETLASIRLMSGLVDKGGALASSGAVQGMRLVRVADFSAPLSLSDADRPSYVRRFVTLFVSQGQGHRGGTGRVEHARNAQGEHLALKLLSLPHRRDGETEDDYERRVRASRAAFEREYECHILLSGLKGFPRSVRPRAPLTGCRASLWNGLRASPWTACAGSWPSTAAAA